MLGGVGSYLRRAIFLVTPTLGGVGSYLRRAIFFLVTPTLGGVGSYASGYFLLITLLLYALMETAN